MTLDPAKLAAIDDDVAELLTQLDGTITTQGSTIAAHGVTLTEHDHRLDELEAGGPTPPPVVIPPVPTAADVSITPGDGDVLISVVSPTATMARFDVDPGATIEEPGLSHVRALDPGDYHAQVAVGNAAGWSEQSIGFPFTVVSGPPPNPTWTDHVTPTELHVPFPPLTYHRWHDLPPLTTALALFGNDWEAGHLVFERISQAIFWNTRGHLHDVDIWNFGRNGGASDQAHGVYGREGLVERVRVHTIDPTAPNDCAAFHAHREDGPVVGLTWRDCENHSGADAIMAGYVGGMTDNVIDGFVQSAGKLRVGVRDEDNGENHFDRLNAAILQIDGTSWSAGTRFSGQVRKLVHAGGLPETVEQMADRYPNVNFDGLAVVP